jgi:hypothetical protein|tara:strand:+ start:1245 stop:1580 length:336 start_codon:yes stop_codon:yes gene_type:complete
MMVHSASAFADRSSIKKVSVTVEDLKDIFEEQRGCCHWLGIPLDPNNNYIANHPLAVSIDRIDNSEGYHKYNIVLCCRFANLGRGPFNNEDFRDVIEFIKDDICGKKNNEE